MTQVRLLSTTVVGGSTGALLDSLADSFLGYPLLGALGVGLGALLFWEKLDQAAHAFFTPVGPGGGILGDLTPLTAHEVHHDVLTEGLRRCEVGLTPGDL